VRNGAWFVRRVWDDGLPLDLALFTRCATFLLHLLPLSFVCRKVRERLNAGFDHVLYALQPSHSILASPFVTNDDLPSRILSGSVQVRPGVDCLTSSGVRFSDGTCVDDVDAIICATGKYCKPREVIFPYRPPPSSLFRMFVCYQPQLKTTDHTYIHIRLMHGLSAPPNH